MRKQKRLTDIDVINFLSGNEMLSQYEQVSLQTIVDLFRCIHEKRVCSLQINSTRKVITVIYDDDREWNIKLFDIQEEN